MTRSAEFRHSQVAVRGSSIHVIEAGDPGARPVVFLHGWPESWRSWQAVMELASRNVRAVAIDLPGVGESSGDPTDGSKRQIARVVHDVVNDLSLQDMTLVGQDVGGMVAYAYARTYELARTVIADVVIPGVDPWDEVLRNPYLWHFAFHSIPGLPERLVTGHQAEYFDYFYDVISADPANDAEQNRQLSPGHVTTHLLYLRGEHEGGEIGTYVTGFREAGCTRVDYAVRPGAGHFTQEEAPADTWRLIADFLGG